MISPLQQTPIPIDPIRQQVTPTTPIAAPAPPPLTETPIKSANTAQDKFNQKNQDEGNSRREQTLTEQQRAETKSKLRNAYLRLTELQQEADAAVAVGNASHAKELAAEATDVAQTIPASVGILQLAEQNDAQSSVFDQTENGGGTTPFSTFDIARAGLGTAKGVIESAASIPYHPIADRIAIDGMRHQVLNAMADVEAIASNAASTLLAAAREINSQHVDVKA
jgi:hypothetical protein